LHCLSITFILAFFESQGKNLIEFLPVSLAGMAGFFNPIIEPSRGWKLAG
jgi:hypothetical protein